MIDKVLKYNLCVGCGLCSSILGHDKCSMSLNEQGFYYPYLQKQSVDESIVKKLCPSIRIHGPRHTRSWGVLKDIVEGWSSDKSIRYKAASGGVITSLSLFLLETKKVDAVLQVGTRPGDYLYNELRVSRKRDDILANAQSRYAPALSLYNIKNILDSSDEKFAFIGKPCDIAGIRNLCELYPQYDGRFEILISIFCGGIPSYNATEKIWKMSGHDDPPSSVKYRGEGWPGYFIARWDDGSEFRLTYNESWGKILGRNLNFRCKICPDGIGMLADLAVGDSWTTKNGYPDFQEQEGRCFVMVRTDRGSKLFRQAADSDYIDVHPLDITKLKEIQPYQYKRRKLEGWRILPIQVFTLGLLDYKGLNIYREALKANYIDGVKNMLGTVKRLVKNSNNG